MRILVCAILLMLGPGAVDPGYREAIEKHRAERLRELTAPNGWLAVRGLFWLHDGRNTAGSGASNEIKLPARAPERLGVLELANGTVTFEAASGATVTALDKPATRHVFDPAAGEKSAIAANGLRIFVIRRGDRFGVRLLDPDAAQRKDFKGIEYFPLNPDYRVTGKFVPYARPRQVPVPNVLGMTVQMESPGAVVFSLGGREYRLEPVYETPKHEDLFFLFKELT